jgi:putative ABC transport system substrate-binding protein
MKRRLLPAALFVSAAILMSPGVGAQAADKLIYGVFWRGCEEVCQGFQDYISEAGIDAEIVLRNAEQDQAKLPSLRQEAREMQADLILTWGTSATLGIAGTLDDAGDPSFNGDIPHVFTVVADPVGAGIVGSLERTNRANITGTYNRVPEAVNINAIRSYDPGFRRLGLLYNANEPNSLLKRDEVAALTMDMDFELVAIELPLAADGKPRVEDIPIKLAELKDRAVDFIYVGSSSFLDKNRDLFTGAAVDLGLPILSPYERLVRDADALISIAARYYDVGRLAGAQAKKILVDGEVPGDIPVARMTEFAYVVNMAVARRLNRYPPLEILQFAETVN